MNAISKFTRLFAFLLLLLLVGFNEQARAQVSGVKTIPGDYSSITDAIQQISAVGVNGATFLELQQGYDSYYETYPIVIRNIPGVTETSTVTISPAAGVTGLTII